MATLITGGAGFIGSELARILLRQGEDRLVLFDINPTSRRVADIAGQVEIVPGDLGNYSHVLEVVKRVQPRRIFHLGARLSVPTEGDPAAGMQTNALGTFHVLEAARFFDVPQVLFTSTIVTFGRDIQADVIDDYTLQRPNFLYGVTKVFGEHLGLFFKRKYGLDFRSVRYPSIIGPGVKTAGVVQYTSWMIEESAKGQPFTVRVEPETRVPVMYYKDAARALVELSEAPQERIKMVNYMIAGPQPIPSAGELAGLVGARVPGAQIDFQPDPALQPLIRSFLKTLDDRCARQEWGWQAQYRPEQMVDDFLQELRLYPERYV
ncbi:MAG: NAD-dependent epimerase/dehydratase family protein [Chloroflexi bacterium]|nr:NAD-dependent epimerase/dehydratase family protein [Chloroflexota bacterium]